MTIYPFPQDTTEAVTSVPTIAYDTPEALPVGTERFMLQQDKLYVVLGVVLIIWLGIVFYLFRTDRKIARLEAQVEPTPDTLRL